MNGTGPYEGRVEICYSGAWKTICDHSWDNYYARLVCAQLHYSPQGKCVTIINPRRMREGYYNRSVCLSVCYHTSCYVPYLCIESKVTLGFSWRF